MLEYAVVVLSDASTDGEELTINNYAHEGWRLVTVIYYIYQKPPTEDGPYTTVYNPQEITKLYFEREKAEHNSV